MPEHLLKFICFPGDIICPESVQIADIPAQKLLGNSHLRHSVHHITVFIPKSGIQTSKLKTFYPLEPQISHNGNYCYKYCYRTQKPPPDSFFFDFVL